MEQKKHSSLAEGVKWFDDWFAIETIVPGLHAIGEPNHHYRNWSYLIEGTQSALLFDSGTGFRNIAPVIDHLTKKPVTVLPSHLHFDHVGNLDKFPTIALADLPMLRALDQSGIIQEDPDLFLGAWENQTWPRFSASGWVEIGKTIDLGRRSLEVLHTPGHSTDSITLQLQSENILLVADFIYPGALYAQVPGSNLADYLASAELVLASNSKACRLFAAHGADPAPEGQRAPEMVMADIADLQSALAKLKASGERPQQLTINERMSLLTCPAAFAPWQNH